jgi:proton glutamate symport protein
MARKKRIALHWKILIGLALGLVIGLLVNWVWTDATWARMGVNDPGSFVSTDGPTFRASVAEGAPNEDATGAARAARFIRSATNFIGRLFLRGLQFIGPPIVLFSLIVGVSSLNDLTKLGRIGGKTVTLYLTTTALAITIGLVLANIIGPGRGFSPEMRDQLAAEQAQNAAAKISGAEGRPGPWETLLDIVPANPFSALATTEMLQIVFAALIIGVALTLIPKEKARPVIAFCDGMTEVIIKIVHIVLLIAPVAVFALIVTVVADLGIGVLSALLKYGLVVIVGLALMMFAVYPAILRVTTPVRYARFYRAISPAQILAFSSSSSGATLPVTMECVEERLGVSEDVTSFVVPLGATLNMDGTALYQGVAAVFIAQIYGLGLGLMDQLTIVLTATLASIGTAAVPGVGIVMLVIVLQAVGIPLEGIAVILGVDRILDMCRTSCNVTGDCMVAAVVASTEGELATEEEVRRRREARPLDEHPLEPAPDQYDLPRQ